MTRLVRVRDGAVARATDLNQYFELFSGGFVYDVKNGFGATGDGRTDDAAAIQRALDAAGQAHGGIVFFPPGHYAVGTMLNWPTGVNLLGSYMPGAAADQGAGPGSQITSTGDGPLFQLPVPARDRNLVMGASMDGFRLAGKQDVIYAPGGAVELRLANLEIAPGRYGIHTLGANQDWKIENTIFSGGQVGIYAPFQRSPNQTVNDVWFDKSYFRKLTFGGQQGNCVRWHADDHEHSAPAPRSNSILWENVVFNHPMRDAFVLGGGARCHTFVNCNDEGVGYRSDGLGDVITRGRGAAGSNSLEVASTVGLQAGQTISVAGAGGLYSGWRRDYHGTITAIDGSRRRVTLDSALAAAVTDAEVTNHVYSVILCTTQGDASPGEISFVGCMLGNRNAAAAVRYAVDLEHASGAFAFVGGSVNRPIYDPSGVATLVGVNVDVLAARPSGAPDPPTLPVSGSPVKNPFGTACTVYISGGSVTDVALDGASTGLKTGDAASATVNLAKAQEIALTYTAVPTWVWIPRR